MRGEVRRRQALLHGAVAPLEGGEGKWVVGVVVAKAILGGLVFVLLNVAAFGLIVVTWMTRG